jgi:hypothetical protein
VIEPTYEFELDLVNDAPDYGGGAVGFASLAFKWPAYVKRIIAAGTLAVYLDDVFVVTDASIDGESIFYGGGEMPACMYRPDVLNNSFRFPTIQVGQIFTVAFRNHTADPSRRPIMWRVTLVSCHPREEWL